MLDSDVKDVFIVEWIMYDNIVEDFIPYINASMNHPLKNHIYDCPLAKVSYSKPRESLKKEKECKG